MQPIPIGKDDFKKLREANCYYVDKTKSIEELLENGSEVILYSRPRRFGKSLFLSTLEHFFDIEKEEENKKLFEGLYIEKSKTFKEFGSYPVIHLDFKNLKQDTYESAYNQFTIMIQNLYNQKEYIKEKLNSFEKEQYEKIQGNRANDDEYKMSIRLLSNWLEKYYGKKVVILIDEYDVPIQEGYLKNYYEEIISFIKSVFSSCLKGNDSLKLGVLTGVLRVSKESIFSDLNNLAIYDMMSKNYNEAFGFTENETKELLNSYGLEFTEEIKNYYDGYNFGGKSIYNPWSILNYVDQNRLQSYWVNTSSNGLIIKLLSEIKEENKIDIENLLLGKSISFIFDNRVTYQDFGNANDMNQVLNLLFMSGFLTYEKEEENIYTGNKIQLFKIPNNEVKEEMIRMIGRITFQKELGNKEYEEFMTNIILGNKEKVEKYMNELLPSTSYHDSKESFYHGYMLGIVSGFLNKRFIVKSNREAGTGRYDVLIEKIDRSFGCIFEFKRVDKEEEMEKMAGIAKNQMKNKEYYKELELDQIKDIKEYIVVFYDKKCIVR